MTRKQRLADLVFVVAFQAFCFAATATEPPTPATPAPAILAQPVVDQAVDENAAQLEKATGLLSNKQAEQALAILDPLIAKLESQYPTTGSIKYYSARSPAETLYYLMLEAAAADAGTVDPGITSSSVLDSTFAYAYYYKAFALLESGKVGEAKQWLDKALHLSPQNAQFHAETGYYHQAAKAWQASLDSYLKAEQSSEFSPEDVRNAELARALRGQGFALIELNRLVEAKARFERSLTLDPDSEMAKNELEYIRGLQPAP